MVSTAVITGASTGIGKATALRFAAEGFHVVGTVRTEASGAKLLEAAGDADVQLAVLDVDSDESVESGFAEILAAVGTIDVLVNNAGISGSGAVEDMPIHTFERQMNTNAFGTLRCCKAVIPSMRVAGRGVIANVTSVAGRIPQAGMAAYNMSKHAQEALTECLAHELRPFGVRVVAIEPGVVRTPIFRKAGDNTAAVSPPYRNQADRILRNFAAALSDPASPEYVADIVWRAATDDDYRMRHAATLDAVSALAARAASTDEEWLAAATVEDDDAWAAWQSRVRGYEVE